jgi:hypothetical protein
VRFATDDRVTITDPKDRWYGEVGYVEDHCSLKQNRAASSMRT